VSGLPAGKPEFAVLPPHFSADADAELIERAVHTVFPEYVERAPERFQSVLVPVLCSLVFHHSWLERVLPPDHPVFLSELFTTPGLLQSLSPLVKIGYEAPDMTATGIPVLVTVQRSIAEVMEHLQELRRSQHTQAAASLSGVIEQLSDVVTRATDRALEGRGLGRVITPDSLEDRFAPLLRSIEQLRQDIAAALLCPPPPRTR
jgi:hypothetical protein